MAKKYDYVIFIGRFQPLHLGHQYVIEQGMNHGKKIIILCGTNKDEARDVKNPWSFAQRQKMMLASLAPDLHQNIIITPLVDILESDQNWVSSAYNIVDEVTNNNKNIALIGHFKDESSYYLKIFTKWPVIEVENFHGINATDVRKLVEENKISELEKFVSKPVIDLLQVK
jgi:bifunctional NMN adenylyltransferase/nudix hydrolase